MLQASKDRRRPVSERVMVVRGERRRRRSSSEEGCYKPKGRPQQYVDAEGRACSAEEWEGSFLLSRSTFVIHRILLYSVQHSTRILRFSQNTVFCSKNTCIVVGVRRMLTGYVTEYGVEYTHDTSTRIHITIRVEIMQNTV